MNEFHHRVRTSAPLGAALLLLLAAGACGTESSTPDSTPPAPVDADTAEGDGGVAEPADDAGEPPRTEPDVAGDAADPDATEAPDDAIEPPGDTAEPDSADPDSADPLDSADVTDDVADPDAAPTDALDCEPGASREQVCDDGSVGSVCACSDEGIWSCRGDGCRDTRCDDGSAIACRIPTPTCTADQVLAVIDGCWLCVNPVTCLAPVLPPIGTVCRSDEDCSPAESCEAPSRPGPPINQCTPHGCRTEPEPICRASRPRCDADEVSVVRGGCWVCVDAETCTTDEPEPPTLCRADDACDAASWCDPCGTSSCPDCDDCVPACRPHGCETETVLECRCVRPDCAEGATSILRDGCWVCVDVDTCRARVDADACGG